MPYSNKANAKQAYGKKGYQRYKKFSKVKKMVTGEGPTLLEKIASGVGGVASVAKAVLPAIAAINTEAKFQDANSTVSAYNPGTNDQVICLTNTVSQGTDDINRIGNSVLAKDINIRLYSSYSADATHLNCLGRMTVLVWKDNAQSNAPTIAKIYESPTVFNSPFNKDYTDQFVILKDKIFACNAMISATQSQCLMVHKLYKKLNFHMRWLNSTTGNTQNHVYLILRGSQAAVGNAMSYTYYTRFNFTDN